MSYLDQCVLMNIKDLKEDSEENIIGKVKTFISNIGLKYGKSQEKSWEECIKYLKNTFKNTNKYDRLYIAFEYVIPLSCYRRPDVILFYKNKILVLEFKRKDNVLDVDKQQLRGYLNELRNYHEESMNKDIKGCLVVTEGSDSLYTEDGIDILVGTKLDNYINDTDEFMQQKEVIAWIQSKYQPLVSIIEATKERFLNGKIPQIKNIENGQLEKTQNYIFDKISNNKTDKNIIFLTGVPGAGKTLVLLNSVYNSNDKNEIEAIFTSGNGPLISVLQTLLSKDRNNMDGKSYIKGVKDIKSLYDKNNNVALRYANTFKNICFDEAQRAWDLKHMSSYSFNVSEPELLLRLQDKSYKTYGATNIICSIGTGQSIYVGEESSFEDLWGAVLNKDQYKDWNIYCPDSLRSAFKNRENVFVENNLDIDTSIRGNFIDTSKLVEGILELKKDVCQREVKSIIDAGYEIKVCRNMDDIKKRLKDMEAESGDASYGLVCSSNASRKVLERNITTYKKILSQMDNKDIGDWYVNNSKEFTELASEFACQGLELNYPVVVFSGDYMIKGNKWSISSSLMKEAMKKNKDYKKILSYENKDQIFKNIYRVLLTRGRNGLIIFVPDYRSLDETYQFFKSIGIKEI